MSEQYTADQSVATIPFFVHEATVERLERMNKRWFIAFIIVLVMLFATNGAWIVYENQFEDSAYSYEITQDSGEGGTNTYTGNTVNITGGDRIGETDDKGNSTPQSAAY